MFPLSNSLPPMVFASRLIEVDILQAFRSNDLVGWLCILGAIFFSVVSWGIILGKAVQLFRAKSETRRFADRIHSSAGNLRAAFQHAREFPNSPLAQLLQEAYVEMEMEQWFQNTPNLTPEQRARWIRDDLERVLSRTIESEMRRLEKNLAFLATTANVTPFIGLFGTVWGILAAFQAVAVTRSATIQAIAPGVSTALMTTVLGLAAAIPAVIAYNIFAARIQQLNSRMESFSIEVTGYFEKTALRKDT